MNNFDRLFSLSGLSLDRMRSFLMVAEAGNLAQAAKGDVTKQSQYSRQIKELEGFFGVALTRRVGRRIEITPEGMRLSAIIRHHFGELNDFRESSAGRGVSIRLGSQGSVIDWLVVPRLAKIHNELGAALVELEQMRSADVVRAVADGRLDFGIVRQDAVPAKIKRWKLGAVGYALFGAKTLLRGCKSVEQAFQKCPVAELLPSGQFTERFHQWLESKQLTPQIFARVSSFTNLSRIVQTGEAAAVLPDLAAIDLVPKQFIRWPVAAIPPRKMVLIANSRSLDRSGIASGIAPTLAAILVAAGEELPTKK